MVDQADLLKFPDKVRYDGLCEMMVAKSGLIKEVFGRTLAEVTEMIGRNSLIVTPSGHDLMLFSKEMIPMGIGKRPFVNPRNIVWSLYQAIEIVKIGHDDIDFVADKWLTRVRRMAGPKNMCLVSISGALYPAFDWTRENPSRDEKEMVKVWITSGRKTMEVMMENNEKLILA